MGSTASWNPWSPSVHSSSAGGAGGWSPRWACAGYGKVLVREAVDFGDFGVHLDERGKLDVFGEAGFVGELDFEEPEPVGFVELVELEGSSRMVERVAGLVDR